MKRNVAGMMVLIRYKGVCNKFVVMSRSLQLSAGGVREALFWKNTRIRRLVLKRRISDRIASYIPHNLLITPESRGEPRWKAPKHPLSGPQLESRSHPVLSSEHKTWKILVGLVL
jgi:hypothetical protein